MKFYELGPRRLFFIFELVQSFRKQKYVFFKLEATDSARKSAAILSDSLFYLESEFSEFHHVVSK